MSCVYMYDIAMTTDSCHAVKEERWRGGAVRGSGGVGRVQSR